MPTINDLINKNKQEKVIKEKDPFETLRLSLGDSPAPQQDAAFSPDEVASPATVAMPDRDSGPAATEISADEFNSPDQPNAFPEIDVISFKEALEILANNIDNKEIVGQATSNILQLIQNNENVKAMLQPEDINLMVKGLRESYGTAIVKKSARKEKTVVNEQNVNKLMKDMSDLDFTV